MSPMSDPQIERIILGACFLDAEEGKGNLSQILGRADPEDFFVEVHRWIFEAIQSLNKRGAPLDPYAVHLELKAQGRAVAVSGILEIQDEYLLGLNLAYYLDQLNSLSRRRSLRSALQDGLKMIEDPSVSNEEAEGTSTQRIMAVIEAKPKSKGHNFCLVSAQALLEEPEEQRQWIWEGILPQGGLSLLVSKPKVGKSTFCRDLARAVSRGSPFLGRGNIAYRCGPSRPGGEEGRGSKAPPILGCSG